MFTKTEPNLIIRDLTATKGSGAIDLLLVVRFLTAIPLIDLIGRILLQIVGFIGCSVGLTIASLSAAIPDRHELKIALIFAGFMLFNFMTNLGPNAMTYVDPFINEVLP